MDSVCFEIQSSQVDIWSTCFVFYLQTHRDFPTKNNSSINIGQPITSHDLNK